MGSLLVLGSKPDPALPPAGGFDDVACANASGFSAARHALPKPLYTVMSAILTATASGTQSLRVLTGLETGSLYFYPRPFGGKTALKRLLRRFRGWRAHPAVLRWKLRQAGFRYRSFVSLPPEYYQGLVRDLCDHDEQILAQIAGKQPSTGVITLLLGIHRYRYERYIMSGFSFELTHAYGHNPEIEERGTPVSRHADTDIAILRYLAQKLGNVYTTEPVVHERTSVPLLPL